MPSPKVFVSSTCYDLGMAREQIRSFLLDLGYDPVMSEYSDVLYDPRLHTHTSCLQDVPNADMVVLLVGSRFGGKVIPEALGSINIDNLLNASFDVSVLDSLSSLSVTQLEVLKAIDHSVPVFAFVDEKVWHDHLVYERNKDLVGKISFPSIEKAESAKFIFEFINFLRQRTKGNSVISFSKIEDIESHLRKQWAALFQRLLKEERDQAVEERKIYGLTEQLEELKTAVLSTIGSAQNRDIARGVIKYRRLADFLNGLNFQDPKTLTKTKCSFEELLKELGIVSIKAIPDSKRRMGGTALLKADGTFYELRYPEEILNRVSIDWQSFVGLPDESRAIILEALSDMRNMGPSIVRYRNTTFEDFFREDGPDSVSLKDFLVEIDSRESESHSLLPTESSKQ
jgi:hypothetical protein